jgi:hypothetical protein
MTEADLPSWWQWWLLIAVTLNTLINTTVFFIGRKFKSNKESK